MLSGHTLVKLQRRYGVNLIDHVYSNIFEMLFDHAWQAIVGAPTLSGVASVFSE